jgi:hypothetical protein
MNYPHTFTIGSSWTEVGADKDKASAVGATALHLAALNGHMEVLLCVPISQWIPTQWITQLYIRTFPHLQYIHFITIIQFICMHH